MNVNVFMNALERDPSGLARLSVCIPSEGLEGNLDISFRELYKQCGIPDVVSFDFLLIASACYAIDKLALRSRAADHWTRTFEVAVPVSAPEIWESVSGELGTSLSFLSGDLWHFSFVAQSGPVFRRRPRSRLRFRRHLLQLPNTACLFSGGVDSLAGALDLLSDKDRRLLLVGHYDHPGPKATQRALFGSLPSQFASRAQLLQVRVSHMSESNDELTLRTRSLVFMALGIYAARSLSAEVPLVAPENGLIATNVPLTPSRAGSCSTRTMHPFFLKNLQRVLRKVGITNRIHNPYELKTKGETITECPSGTLLKALLDRSVSCSHATRRQYWHRKSAKNCGYCFPCIIRRAAFHRAGIDMGTRYGIDICAGELTVADDGDSADDLRAVLDFLQRRKSRAEIACELRSVAPLKNVDAYADVVYRGLDEIRCLIHERGTKALRRAVGTDSPNP